MSAVAITTASSRYRWGVETTFGTVAPALTRRFGLDSKITPLVTSPTEIELANAGQRTLSGFAYGTNKIDMTIGWAMTNPWWLQLIFGKVVSTDAVTTTGSEAAAQHVFSKKATPTSFTTNVKIKGTDAGNPGELLTSGKDLEYNILGCTIDSLDLKCGIDEVAAISAKVMAGNYALTETAFTEPADDANTDNFAYTSIGGSISLVDGSTTTEIVQVKDIGFNISTGQSQEYAFGSPNSQSSLGGALRYSGSFTGILTNAGYLKSTLARNLKTSLTVTFSNDQTGEDERSISFKFDKVSFSKHELALQRTDRIDNKIDWKALECTVTVKSGSNTLLK